jgi:DNA-binding beta-propeller fold protein YncE
MWRTPPNRIQAIDSTGTFITKFGTAGSDDRKFSCPAGVAVNSTTSSLYVTDRGNNRIQVFDPRGTFITKFGSFGNSIGQFNGPTVVAVNPTKGNVYVVDSGNNSIQVFFLDP